MVSWQKLDSGVISQILAKILGKSQIKITKGSESNEENFENF